MGERTKLLRWGLVAARKLRLCRSTPWSAVAEPALPAEPQLSNPLIRFVALRIVCVSCWLRISLVAALET